MSGRLPSAELRPVRDGEAEVGERVTVLDLRTSVVHDYRLVERGDRLAVEGEVSIHTPLGSALLGSHVGDVVSVDEPGRTLFLEVVEIDG